MEVSPSSSASASSVSASPSVQTSGISSISKVSPGVLLIIIILAIIFFVSGLLHLLVRYLMRPSRRDPDESLDSVTALQGQLQQLFHLHDSGVDQSFIDTLPVFNYKAIIGLKSPFDCAVCLSEFEAEDKLRLLPKCSHAFHMDCIDTWLLSHSTCPLCRANLIPDFSSSSNRHFSPLVLVLESGSDSSREIVPDSASSIAGSVARVESIDFRASNRRKSCEIQVRDEDGGNNSNPGRVVSVKLGKYRNVDQNGGESSSTNKNVDSRRCFSMGSFAYIMDENSSLQVPIRTPIKKPPPGAKKLPLNPGHRLAMSECGGGDESRREFVGFETFRNAQILENTSNKAIGNGGKKESFSFSKIWLRGKREEMPSRRAFSFRFPVQNGVAKGSKNGVRRTISEVEFGRWENDLDSQSICSLDSQANHPSFARKTLLWLMGRQQNKVVHDSDSQFSSQIV